MHNGKFQSSQVLLPCVPNIILKIIIHNTFTC